MEKLKSSDKEAVKVEVEESGLQCDQIQMNCSLVGKVESTKLVNIGAFNSINFIARMEKLKSSGKEAVKVEMEESGLQSDQIQMNCNLVGKDESTKSVNIGAFKNVTRKGKRNNATTYMPLSQHTTGALQPAKSKYVKLWEGNLSGQRRGQPVLISRMEGYRRASDSDKLAANWPQTMLIVRLISQDHINNQYVGKADFLVFRALNQHGFLGQLQEKKLCAVIQLPSQTLLLSVSDRACRLIGMLYLEGKCSNALTNMPLSRHTAGALQSTQSKYVKIWEGNLSGQRQGQPVFITRMEGYRHASASDELAANWPQTMLIVRLISQDRVNNKQYAGKADFLVFRALNQHGFLGQLQEKKLCAVIQLPSQTLLLSIFEKAYRLIGTLFPGDAAYHGVY